MNEELNEAWENEKAEMHRCLDRLLVGQGRKVILRELATHMETAGTYWSAEDCRAFMHLLKLCYEVGPHAAIQIIESRLSA